MQQFMAEIDLPAKKTEQFLKLIPLQRSFVERMFQRGIITSYALAIDRTKIWVTFATSTQEEAEAVIRKFPITEYISYKMHELAFRNSLSNLIPAVSLN
jgi:outer membrane protein assembly factor BamD (BamD/ComL family)